MDWSECLKPMGASVAAVLKVVWPLLPLGVAVKVLAVWAKSRRGKGKIGERIVSRTPRRACRKPPRPPFRRKGRSDA